MRTTSKPQPQTLHIEVLEMIGSSSPRGARSPVSGTKILTCLTCRRFLGFYAWSDIVTVSPTHPSILYISPPFLMNDLPALS